MIESLKPTIKEVLVAFMGFSKDGVSWEAPRYKGLFLIKFGSKKDFRKLKTKCKRTLFIYEFVKASSKSGDYKAYSDLAKKKINEQTYRFVEV